MNKEEILNKYINLIDKGYCSDCNELNCIDNFPHAKIAHAIRELQQENQRYKEVIDKVSTRLEYFLIGNLKYQSSQEEFIKLLNILKEVE